MNRVEQALKSATETRALEIGSNIISETGTLFRRLFPEKKAIIVADTNTFPIAGRAVQTSLQQAGVRQDEPYVITDPMLHAEWKFVELLDQKLQQTEAIPIAVGSGTINDLCKLSSHRAERRYMSVATAASMDGYTSYGASITADGDKKTFSCPAPLGVLADTAIIARAPREMTASGYADLFTKVPAGADWIIADALGVEAIDPVAFSIVQDGLKDALADPQGVVSGDEKKIEALIEGLMLGGFAMQSSHTSRPASGADHQFSHLWNMEHHEVNGHAPSHGFQVAIGMLASTALYERLFAEDVPSLNLDECLQAWPTLDEAERQARELYAGTDFSELGVREIRAKYIPHAQLAEQLSTLKNNWHEIKTHLQAQIVPFAEVKRRLDLVGAPSDPAQIGISRERMRAAFLRAQHMRRRFTILDVAVRMNRLDRWVEQILGPQGVWAPQNGKQS